MKVGNRLKKNLVYKCILYSKKQLKNLDFPIQKRIVKFIDNLEEWENPRIKGKSLTDNLSGFWRYRVSDYGIIFDIEITIYT